MSKEEELNVRSVLKAHSIELVKKGQRNKGIDGKEFGNPEEEDIYYCNDGDGFRNVWEALEHTIWLDLMACHPEAKTYHELINQLSKKFER
jgi:hypothetical protein